MYLRKVEEVETEGAGRAVRSGKGGKKYQLKKQIPFEIKVRSPKQILSEGKQTVTYFRC